MATSIIKTEEIRRLNGDVLMTEGALTANVDMSNVALAANHSGVKSALNASGDAPIYACRAWVNFDGTFGTSPFTIANGGIRASGNVSSITDNGGTGDYTVNFTTAMPDANYCVQGSGQYTSTLSVDDCPIVGIVAANHHTPSVSSVRIGCSTDNATATNPTSVYISIFR